MKVVVKGRPKSLASGRWECTLSSEGMTLTRKGRVISLPVGSQAVYFGGNRFSVPCAEGHLDMQIVKFACYQHRMARDLVDWLCGKREMPAESSYALESSLSVLCALPFGIPVITLGGGLPALLAFGLAALNFQIAQRGDWSKAGRFAGCLSVVVLGYAMVVAAGLWLAAPGKAGVRDGNNRRTETPVYKQPSGDFERDRWGRRIWSGPVEGGTIPTPRASDSPLSGRTRSVEDLSVQSLNLDVENLSPTMQWSGDGKHLFLFGSDGVLRRVAFPSLVEEIVLETKQTGGSMRWCRVGLIVVIQNLGQIWLIDPKTLEVKNRFHTNENYEFDIASSRTRGDVYISDRYGDRLTLIDVEQGKTRTKIESMDLHDKYFNQLTSWDEKGYLGELSLAAMSPDGKFIFCEGSDCLNRFRIIGDELVFEERSPKIGSSNPLGIYISPDSQYVALPSGGGNDRPKVPEGYPEEDDYVTYLYRTSDLKYPALVLTGGRHPGAIQIDPVSGKIYMENSEKHLIIFDDKGVRLKDYQLSHRHDHVKQILVHPTGGRMLILTDENLLFVDLLQE